MDVPCEDYDVSIMIKAITEVQALIKFEQFQTFSELDVKIGKTLKKYEPFGDGFERFHVFLTKDVANVNDLTKSLGDMNERCQSKLRDCECSQKDQINDMLPFVRNTSKILVHGSGNLLALAIACAIQEHEGVHFFICEGRPGREGCPNGSGDALIEKVALTSEGIRLRDKLPLYCTIIPDSGVGSIMGIVDFVITGAYCVTKHGGLVHSTGSMQLATVAFSMNVPFYVLCETFKFAHIFPLSTEDLKQPDSSGVVPLVEFVPPTMITLIFSEKGIMPPSAVADEMFRFHTAPFAPWKHKQRNEFSF
ncbi:unnamed protein product [Phytomonas sp. EM1]|nr:unnamed protein product [Phytomonas sp. EM1]|eukprot:CCW65261.1 unnamed protein product [Phytomonas sp. isolate EM1]